MQGKYLAIPVLGMLLSFAAKAQTPAPGDTVIKGATIEIIQSYKPEVTRAPRPEPAVSLPPVDTSTPALQYHTPPQTLFYSYGSLPLRPLALDITKDEPGYDSYIKLGGGNQGTVYFDAANASVKGDNYETSLHLQHLSQAGAIADQKLSLNALDAEGKYHHGSGKAFGAQLGVSSNRYHYYGYNHDIYNYDIEQVKQAFTGINLLVNMEDELAEAKKFNYTPSIRVSSFSDRYNASETTFGIAIPATYNIDSNLQLYAAANITLTGYKNSMASVSNNIVQLAPGVRFAKGIFTGHAGISPTIGETDPLTGKSAFFLPDIEVNFSLPETQFIFSLGWQGNLVQNSYQQLATINPYMSNLYTPLQTRTNEVFGGIKSNLGTHITFNGRVSWWRYDLLPLFINDTAGDGKQFMVRYEPRVNAIGLQAAIRYQVAQILSLGLDARWTNFYDKSYEELWHTPGVRVTGDVQAQPIKKLTINAYISFIDELYALENNNRTLKLNSILDIGAGAEYEVYKRVNIFLQANNLLNSKYQRWYGYDALGLNIFGGARLKF